jgi:Peptidase family M23
MMTFRPHSVVAVMLFSTMIYAQSSSPAPGPQATGTAKAASSYAAYPMMSAAVKERGRKLFDMFKAGQAGAIWATSPAENRKRADNEKKFVATLIQWKTRLGPEKTVLAENLVPYMLKRSTVYSRLSEFTNAKVPVATMIIIDENGDTEAFTIRPIAVPPEGHDAGYKDTAKLKLPLSGDWLVYQGGHGPFNNVYQLTEDQRFAIDFVLLKNGSPFQGDATTNEQFYCFGQPVLSPADGTVVRVVNSIGDNAPGKPSQETPNGNMIMISHGSNEYSVLTNLKQNSVKLKHGDVVKRGDPVGECGNSGASAVPKVHYQLQNSAGLPSVESLPAQFVDIMVDGKPVAEAEVVRGQIVSNGPAAGTPQPVQPKK